MVGFDQAKANTTQTKLDNPIPNIIMRKTHPKVIKRIKTKHNPNIAQHFKEKPIFNREKNPGFFFFSFFFSHFIIHFNRAQQDLNN